MNTADSWALLGAKIRPLRSLVVVHTFKLPEKTPGGIYLPKADFYDGMANEKLIRGLVLATGPKVSVVKEGDVVLFQRLGFARFEKMADGTFVGWVEQAEILARIQDLSGDLALGPFTGVTQEDK